MKFLIVVCVGGAYVFTAWYFKVPLVATSIFALAGCVGGHIHGYLEGSKR